MLNRPMLTPSRPTAGCVQHVGSICTHKATPQPSARPALSSRYNRYVSLIAKERRAPCHDSTYIAAANRISQNDAPPGTYSDGSKVLLSPKTSLPSHLEGTEPANLPLDQGNGGSSGNGSGGGSGRGDGDGDESDSSGAPQSRGSLFFQLIGLLFRGPVLAILISVFVYNWLQARRRRQQTAVIDAGEQSASATDATLFLGDDWPPVHASAQQKAAAPYGLGEQHVADRKQSAGPLNKLAGLLPWTRSQRTLRQALGVTCRHHTVAFHARPIKAPCATCVLQCCAAPYQDTVLAAIFVKPNCPRLPPSNMCAPM